MEGEKGVEFLLSIEYRSDVNFILHFVQEFFPIYISGMKYYFLNYIAFMSKGICFLYITGNMAD